MNRTVLTVLKAVAGLLVLFLLLYTVSNWWQEYRSEAAKPRSSAESTVGEGSEASESPAAASAGATVVVLVDGLNLREEPDGNAKTLQGLDKDEKVVLVKQEGKWYEVKTANGKTGWISASPSYSRVENP